MNVNVNVKESMVVVDEGGIVRLSEEDGGRKEGGWKKGENTIG